MDSLSEEMIVCPFDQAHVIEKSRLVTHVTKCIQNCNKKKVKCPFNACHILDKYALNEHLKECPERGNFNSYVYSTDGTDNMVGESVSHPDTFDSTETWDLNGSTYDPNTNRRDVILIPHGAKPAERRAFRQEQRRNYKS